MGGQNAAVDEKTKLNPLRKIGYACGDFACNMSWSLISGYLVFFFTDIALIPAGTVGTVMLISKAWDAINDPIVGSLADRTKSRWGRYRPWVIFSCVPMLVFNVLTFTTSESWSQSFRTVWGFAMYFILVLLYTMVNVTYSAMPTTLTRDTETRSSLASYRMTGAFLAMTVLSGLLLRVVEWGGGGASGYQKAAIVFSLIALPFFLITFFSTKEVVEIPYEKIKYKNLMSTLKGNRPVLLLLIAFMVWGVIQGGMTFKIYYFTYNAGDQMLYSNTQLLQSIVGMLGTFSVTYLVKKVKNKGTLPAFAFLFGGISCIICYFLPITTGLGVAIYYVMTVVYGFCMGMLLASIFGMIPDTAEYTMYHYGVFAAGFLSTIINFALKVGQALSIAVAGWLLEAVGYVANETQSGTTLFTINFMSHIFVGVLMLVAAASMFAYKLDKKTYNEIVEKLERGETAASAAAAASKI